MNFVEQSLIDITGTRYQDVLQHESPVRMDPEGKRPRITSRDAAGMGDNLPVGPEGKRPKITSREASGIGNNSAARGYLDGQCLIAMPVMDNVHFERSVIYLCAHSAEGAMGIIVNRPVGSIDFPELLVQLDIIKKADQIKLPENAGSMKVLKGGPCDTGRGFVLHSSDFFIKDATLRIDDDVCLTATVDILRAIAKGAGPKHAILALGYAGWKAGQLETEIQGNGWLHCDADPDLIFGSDVEEKYLRALRKIGIDPGMLSNEAGHA
jgi:putative transcriptional regulator